MTQFTATYSPEDNKLRLYSAARLDDETYQALAAVEFRWAPKQELFVAPAWTPEREDALLALVDDIEDEQTTLAERAAERGERFEMYSDRRLQEAEAAHAQVHATMEHIPLGQPILVGHHSERRARKDAERIETGMRKAVKLAETSRYWDNRARGAVRHAAIKADPGVRQRRIKGLEADERKFTRQANDDELLLKAWSGEVSEARALFLANLTGVYRCYPLADYPRELPASQYEGRVSLWSALNDKVISHAQATEFAKEDLGLRLARARRWLHHIAGRLAYERAQLEAQGIPTGSRFDFVRGGQVMVRCEWLTVLRVNKGAGGAIVTLTTTPPAARSRATTQRVGVEMVTDYRAPAAGADGVAAAAAPGLPPIVNHPGEGIREITSAEWAKINRDYKGVRTEAATAEHGAYRYRRAVFFDDGTRLCAVYLTDKKRVDLPAAADAGQAAA